MSDDTLLARASALGLNGIVSHWDELDDAARAIIARLLGWEEAERARRSLERRIRDAKLGRFKAIADFDWSHPRRCNRVAIDDLFTLKFLDEPANVVLLGPNGIGKTTIAQNVAHKALLDGNTVRFTTASAMLGDLAGRDGPMALQRRLKHYIRPRLLVIDEVGYLSYGTRHADLLFEVISQRMDRSTMVTTNKPFSEWTTVFPDAACVVTLVDRLVHRCDIIELDGDSYRLKASRERAARKSAGQRKKAGR